MREIKFRAWNMATKVMVDLHKITPLILNIDTAGLFIPFSDGLPLMQYTGLKDNNGKEIYEGDILKESWKPCGDDAAVSGEYIGEIFYEDAGYWTKSKNHHHAITETYDSYEVIGNIYEHSELLK